MVLMALLLLSCSGYCIFIAARCNVKAEETPLIASALVILLLYLSSLAGLLRLISQLLYFSGLLLLPLTLFLDRKELPKLARSIATPGAAMFALGAVALFWGSRHVVFSSWDEFSHWGLIWKVLYTTHQLPPQQNALLFPSYPPATALFQYYVSSHTLNREDNAVFAQMLLAWSAVMPLMKGLRWKQLPLVLLAAFIGLACYLKYNEGFWLIYQDGLLGLLFAGGFALYWSRNREKLSILKAAPVAALMALTKETGTLLALLLCFILLIDLAFTGKHREKKFLTMLKEEFNLLKTGGLWAFLRRNGELWCAALLLLAPVGAALSWNAHLKTLGLPGSSNAVALPAALQQIGEVLSAARTPHQTNILNRFFGMLVSSGVGPTRQGFQWLFSVAGCTALFVACCVALAVIFRKEATAKRLLLTALTGCLSVAAFLAGLLYTYLFVFGSPALPSYSRYTSTIAAAMLLIAFHLLLQHSASAEKAEARQWVCGSLAGVLLALLLVSMPVKLINAQGLRVTASTARRHIAEASGELKRTARPNEKVYSIWQGTTGLSFYMTRYEFYPLVCNKSQWNLGVDNPGDVWSSYDYTADEWAGILAGYQYVYIGKADQTFWDRYGSLFEDQAADRSKKLFKIVPMQPGGIKIISID